MIFYQNKLIKSYELNWLYKKELINVYRRQLYGRGCFICKFTHLAVFSREEHIFTRVMVWYQSNSTVFMGPHPCMNGIPPCVYHGYRGYTVTVV